MKYKLGILLVLLLGACAFHGDKVKEKFENAPSAIDAHIETASIEDYVIALPPFAYHEESVSEFVKHVRHSRSDSIENRGKGADYLFVKGDGSWPSKDFILNRKTRTLTIHVHVSETDTTDYTEEMRRVPGGWMRSPQISANSVHKTSSEGN